MKRLGFDKSKCTECHSCELMCSYSKLNTYNTKKALLRVLSNFPEAPDMNYCRQCSNPKCLSACSFDAISIADGIVLIDVKNCNGCGKCMEDCPFESIFMRDNNAFKCDNCSGAFKCTQTCKTGALYVKE